MKKLLQCTLLIGLLWFGLMYLPLMQRTRYIDEPMNVERNEIVFIQPKIEVLEERSEVENMYIKTSIKDTELVKPIEHITHYAIENEITQDKVDIKESKTLKELNREGWTLPLGFPFFNDHTWKEYAVNVSYCDTNNTKFVITSFYTHSKDTHHRKIAHHIRMQKQCNLFKLCCVLIKIDESTLKDNIDMSIYPSDTALFHILIALKPRFLLHCLNIFQLPILWLDIDLTIIEYPKIFNGDVSDVERMHGINTVHNIDIIVQNWQVSRNPLCSLIQQHNKQQHINIKPQQDSCKTYHIASGIFYANYTTQALNLLQSWSCSMSIKHNQVSPDDQVFDYLMNNKNNDYKSNLNIMNLPSEYLVLSAYLKQIPSNSVILHEDRVGSFGGNRKKPVDPYEVINNYPIRLDEWSKNNRCNELLSRRS